MRSYQLEGYEWMATLWENGINGILADEMGLGKTIQTVALFCHLYEMGVTGPFLVVAPLSTVPNWVNEFKRFAPTVPCVLYHGSANERIELRGELKKSYPSAELDGKIMNNVVVTSYEIAMNDRAAFSSILWRYIVVDEGHRLKNMNCRLIKELKQYHSANRLLLTGTPLQNNLSELWSLLNFLLPEIFDDLRVFESWFDAKDLHENQDELARITAQEQKNSILSTLHQILTPFLLRRVKSDVDLEIPPKKEVMVYCPMTTRQMELYRAVVEKTIGDLMAKDEKKEEALPEKRKKAAINYAAFLDHSDDENEDDDKFEEHLAKMQEYADSVAKTEGPASAYTLDMKRLEGNEKNFSVKSRMMDMRKCVNHPYLIEYPITEDGMFYDSGPDMVDICGKLQVFDQMIVKLVADGHKTLIFSQMTKMLDILGDYSNFKKWKFCRLDGSMQFIDRQANIDTFNKDPEHKVFLLSTRAGGLGINLTAADTCIIYDSDWNPQQDLQAQDRCHRIGQTRPVVIFRLITQNTIDENIVQRAQAKRAIEKLIVHQDKFKSGITSLKETTSKVLSPKEILKILLNEDDGVDTTEEASADQYGLDQETLDKLLDRSDIVKEWKEKGGILKKEEEYAKMKSDDTLDNGMAPKEEEDEDVLESLFECLICQRPIMCKASVVIKMCGRFSCKFQTERLRKGPKVVLDKTDIPRFLTPELFDKPKPKPKYKNGKKVKERAPRPKKPYVPKPKFLGPKSRDPKKIAAAAKKKAEASIYNNIITILSSDEEGAEEEEESESEEEEEEEEQEVQSVKRPRGAPKQRQNQVPKSKQKQKLTPVKKKPPSKPSQF